MENQIIKKELQEPPFFAVSTTKFILMSIITLNFYELYWFYKNWVLIKNRDNKNIMPLMRSIFSIFFIYSLFSYIRKYANEKDINVYLSSGFLTVLYIAISLNTGFALYFFDNPWDKTVYFITTPSLTVLTIILLPANKAVEKINNVVTQKFKNTVDLSEEELKDFTRGEYIAIILGIINWVIVFYRFR